MLSWTKKIGLSRYGPPPFLKFRSSTTFIITTVYLSIFTDSFLYGMIVPVIPNVLVERVGVSTEDRAYWASVLLMSEAGVATVLCPIFGFLIDFSGTRQLPFLFGLFLLVVSMVLLATSYSLSFFIAARLLQGGATAMVYMAGMALVTDVVPTEMLGQALGYLGSANALGLMTGPLLGGLIYHVAGYMFLFVTASVFLIMDFILRLVVLEKRVANRWLHPKLSHVFARTHGRSVSLVSISAASIKAVKEQSFALFKLLSQPRVLIIMWANIARYMVISAFEVTLPLFVMDHFHWRTMGAGLIFLPYMLPAFFEPVFGYISDRFGVRAVSFVSFLILGPAIICLRFIEDNSRSHKIIIFVLLGVAGLSTDLSEPALFLETQQILEEKESEEPGIFGGKGAAVAQSFSLLIASSYIGLFFGPMCGGFVHYRFGWKVMTLVLGLFICISAIPTLWLSGKQVPQKDNDGLGERQPLLAD